MAFTGQKVKGSRVLTEETLINRKRFHALLREIEANNKEVHDTLIKEMFGSMFEHLSHSSQKELIKWAENVERKTFFGV
jgi:hypothetical protein